MAKKTTSPAEKARFAVYKSNLTWKTNREASLKRHLVKHPEDEIAQAALKALAGKTKPRRAGHSAHRVVVDGQVIRASDRLYRELAKLVKAAGNAAKFEQKKEARESQGRAAKGRKAK